MTRRPPTTALFLALSLATSVDCKPAGETVEAPPEAPRSRAPTGPLRISDWVAANRSAGASARRAESVATTAPPPDDVADARGVADAADQGAPDATPAAELTAEVGDAPPLPAVAQGPDGKPLPVHPDMLPMTLVATLEQPTSRADADAARALNKKGLDQHRKGELAGAISDYEAALARAPSQPFARYNLACALALSHRDVEALHHLAVLAHLATRDRSARDRLAAARVDDDFEALRTDPRFRALTLATPVLVTWAANTATTGADHEVARALHKRLREARWGSTLSPSPWQPAASGSALKLRAGADLHDQNAARSIHALLEELYPGRYTLEVDAPLPTSGPALVLVVATSPSVDVTPNAHGDDAAPGGDRAMPGGDDVPDDDDATPPEGGPRPAPEETADGGLERLFGRRLTAQSEGRIDTLEVRATGFFAWETREGGDSPRTRVRQGRWTLLADEGLITLRYSERQAIGEPPRVEVVEGVETTHRVVVSRTAGQARLELDGLRFR